MLVVYCKIHCKILIYSRNCLWQATCSHMFWSLDPPTVSLFPFVRYSCSYLHAGPLFDTLTAATFESKGWSPVSKGKILRQKAFFYFVDSVSLLFRIFLLYVDFVIFYCRFGCFQLLPVSLLAISYRMSRY